MQCITTEKQSNQINTLWRRGDRNKYVIAGLTMGEGVWDGDKIGSKYEAEEMNMRSRCNASVLETMSGAR